MPMYTNINSYVHQVTKTLVSLEYAQISGCSFVCAL